MSGAGRLVNLTDKTDAALVYGAAMTGNTETDIINKSVQAWVALVEHQQGGGKVLLLEADGATVDEFTLNAEPKEKPR